MNTVLDQEVVSTLDDRYSANRVASKVERYSLFVRWSKDG